MINQSKIVITTCAFLLCLGCQSFVKDIEFKRLEKVSISNIKNKNASLKGTFVLYNPNPVKIDLKNANFDVWLDGKEIGKISQTIDALLPAKGEADVTLEMDIDLADVWTIEKGGILDMGLKLLRNEDLIVRYKGAFKTGKSAVSIPIKVEETINLTEKRFQTDVH